MDILSVIGIAVFCLGMFLAVGMEADQLLHGRSFNIVIVGSLGVVMLRSTLAEFLNLFPTVLKVFRHKVDKPTDLIDQMVELATIARKDGMIALENQEISNRMLAKGVRALVDGNDAGFVRSSLERDTLITSQRHESARSILQSWGDTAPAMGMIGTLIGLVLLLAKLEEDPAGIGAGMSTALITLKPALIFKVNGIESGTDLLNSFKIDSKRLGSAIKDEPPPEETTLRAGQPMFKSIASTPLSIAS